MREINVDVLHEELFKQKPLLSFDDKRDYKKWKKEIKKKYISLLGLDVIEQNACDPDLLIEETKEFETYTAWRQDSRGPHFTLKNNSYSPAPDRLKTRHNMDRPI